MPGYPVVYIIVLNYNRAGDTLDCLASLYAMDYPSFRVIVVDNASTDGSADAVRAAFPDAVLIENDENLLYAGGNNVGMSYALDAGADYVLLVNNDTLVGRDMLRELVDAVRARPGAGLAGPMIYYHPPRPDGRELIWYAGGVVSLWRGLTAHRGIRRQDRGLYTETEDTGYVTGCGLLASRACLEKTGLLDPAYGMYAEDADLSLRAARAGFSLLFVPRAKMWHKVSMSSGGEFGLDKMRRKARANLLLLYRYARPWHWLTIPFFTAARAAAFLAGRLLARGRAALSACVRPPAGTGGYP